MKDALGVELQVGDKVGYSRKCGSSLWITPRVIAEIHETPSEPHLNEFRNRVTRYPVGWLLFVKEDGAFSRGRVNPLNVVKCFEQN